MYSSDFDNSSSGGAKIGAWLVGIVVAIFIIIVLLPFYTIGAGERGVVLNWGAFNGEVSGEGLHFRTPIKQSIIKMNVQVQKEEVAVSAASSDLQTVSAKIAVNYHLNPEKVGVIYQTIGKDFKERVISPAIQEAMKSTTAKFTAEELVTKREIVKDEAKTNIKNRLAESNIVVDDFNIVNFDFSESFNTAIEAKVTAEQNALASKNKLEQVKYEAQQQIEQAKGKSEAIRVEAQALKDNPQLTQLRAVEKWNGVLPVYMTSGAPTPFLDVNQLQK